MKELKFIPVILAISYLISVIPVGAQDLMRIQLAKKTGIVAESYAFADSTLIKPDINRPVFSFDLDDRNRTSADVEAGYVDGYYVMNYDRGLQVLLRNSGIGHPGLKWDVIFENRGSDTLTLSNVVPFGEDKASVYITGAGEWDLARAWLHRPGFRPLRVILPDNAWEMGFITFPISYTKSVASIARRISIDGGTRRRYDTELPPGAKVVYAIYSDVFSGTWQEGLQLMFRDRYLYDIGTFDNTLYERPDLQWIRNSYLIILQYPWDIEYYDRFTGKYTFPETLRKYNELFGHIDVFGIWPTWPRLGLDQRNQWDLYRNLPGGTEQLRSFSRLLRQYDSRLFIAYNPWDNSTRDEGHLKGMADMISSVEADGVVLDTKGSSSYELQHAADSVREGVVMYSEGMAVVRDMPEIISGRVHNAIFMSPELNLNKVIKPDFAIFRVGDVGEDYLKRELAIAFFNGYGTELNMFRPGGRNEYFDTDMDFLSKTTFVLRQNSNCFIDMDWTPLINTVADNLYVNKWQYEQKTVFTVLNMSPEGYNDYLFENPSSDEFHYVSIWHHEELIPEKRGTYDMIPVRAGGWHEGLTNTRGEGSIDCIALFPELIDAEIIGNNIRLHSPGRGTIRLWRGNPSYSNTSIDFVSPSDTTINIYDLFGYYEGKIVIQFIADNNLTDEKVLRIMGGKPWLISEPVRTEAASSASGNMVLVPSAEIKYRVAANDNFIPHPLTDVDRIVAVDSFLIDRYPVTNADWYNFILKSGYRPRDTTNYLKHWYSGTYRQGQANYPVVWISYEDALEYSKWEGKRLPTEDEWQLAAQGTDGRLWPWGNEFYGTRCNNSFERSTPVDAFSKGASPYGVEDMVGNVWQMTADIYFNGNNHFMIIRGGSYFKPESSWWYIQGGPQQLDKTQMLLMVSPGFDRSATVGFRCVRDVAMGSFRSR
ncbi:MAG: SUMF1/EgtB/PvdO family nonheme iron enzyme [Bacteroidales bacterium]|nr:SUMF1/EgtB/PvdO family nonheme iron enzyme [Bacteroidales bacterium]